MQDIEIGLTKYGFITLKPLEYKNIIVPKGFIFDGITLKAPLTFLLSGKDLRQGIFASCFHDYMCQRKYAYKRSYATKILVELWLKSGLNPFKASLVKFFVNTYQLMKGWK